MRSALQKWKTESIVQHAYTPTQCLQHTFAKRALSLHSTQINGLLDSSIVLRSSLWWKLKEHSTIQALHALHVAITTVQLPVFLLKMLQNFSQRFYFLFCWVSKQRDTILKKEAKKDATIKAVKALLCLSLKSTKNKIYKFSAYWAQELE